VVSGAVVVSWWLVLWVIGSLLSWLEARKMHPARVLDERESKLRFERDVLREQRKLLDRERDAIEQNLEEQQDEQNRGFEAREKQLERQKEDFSWLVQQQEERLQQDKETILTLARQKAIGFPHLAQAYADYFELRDNGVANYLILKPHPALKASGAIRDLSRLRRRAEKAYRVLKYQLDYYEQLFPWLIDFKGEELDDLVRSILDPSEILNDSEEPADPVRKWLTEAEYRNLSTCNKNQLALDRYWQKKKSKWEIGKDYERYVGYLYEQDGFAVKYQGIVKGLADLGRDLIVTRGDEIVIVQCKCWSRHKTIHEKHIFQLFGTTIEYWLKYPSNECNSSSANWDLADIPVKGAFITSTSLSPEAKRFAETLRVDVREDFPLETYPSVKCNVSHRAGEKIYHLPFDQQYDTTVIEEEKNECYVASVQEAEALGFRRAFRWRGPEVE